jgi:uncharacterized membrane protein
MSELVRSVFAGEESAVRALRDLRAALPSVEGLASAATVSVGAAGSYAVGTTGHPGSGAGFPGVFWEALFGLVFLVAAPGSSYGPSSGALFGMLTSAGVDDAFLGRARTALVSGTSGVALLLSDDEREPVLEVLRSYGGTLVRTSLSAEQEKELERELGGPA